jgi:hypothetical protein
MGRQERAEGKDSTAGQRCLERTTMNYTLEVPLEFATDRSAKTILQDVAKMGLIPSFATTQDNLKGAVIKKWEDGELVDEFKL